MSKLEVINFEISPIELPTEVAELRRSVTASKAIELYGITRQFFDINFDNDIERALSAQSDRSIYVAHEPDNIEDVVGFVSYETFLDTSSLNIREIAVSKTHRKRGIGAALLQTVERDAEKLDMSSITLDASNREAIRFYKNQGYKRVDPFDTVMQLRVPR